MEDNIKKIYPWILLSKEQVCLVGSLADNKPIYPEGEGVTDHWIEWNKELPEDIDDDGVIYLYDKKTKDLVKQ